MSRSSIIVTVLSMMAAHTAAIAQDSIKGAYREFLSPEDSTRTKVWWFHGETPTTREGITADLQAFKDAGVGGVVYYDQVHGKAEGAARVFSKEWWDGLKFSASEAKRLGLSFEINLSNGYVAGGPWISKEMSMKRLTSSEMTISGGKHVSVYLPKPSDDDWYEDIATLAFPMEAECSTDIDLTGSLEYSGRELTVRSITYTAPKHRKSRNGAMNYPDGPAESFYGMMYYDPDPAGWLEYSKDGNGWTQICELPTPGGAVGLAQRTIAFEPVTAAHFRIRTGGVKLSQAKISTKARIDRWEEKASYFSEFHDSGSTPDYREGVISPDTVIDISSNVGKDGKLDWDVPAGNWIVMRIACESTRGATKHGRPDAMGLECDKMSTEAIDLHWNSYAGRIIDTLSAYGLKPKGVTMDSHEAGPQNWTREFPAIFMKRNGYDMIRLLPAMRGYIVGSTAETLEFLHDVRTTISHAIGDNYYGRLNALCEAAGVEFTAQAAGNGLSLAADNIMLKSKPGKPQGEFWARDIHGSYDIIDCASTAHVTGRKIASAEAFTDAKYSDSPATLKMLADFAYASLLNEFVVCASAYQPRLDQIPGNVANGRQYCLNRNNTIWPYSKPFWDYQARCAGLLRKGQPVIDVLVYAGDDVPVKTLAHLLPLLPEGYNFDITTADGLDGARVENGRLVLKSGMSYGMLVVQRNVKMANSIRELQKAGLPVAHPQGAFEEVEIPFEPDLAFHSARKIDDCLRFGHRRLDDADVYFIYNHSLSEFNQTVKVRSPYKRIYRLDPLDGSCISLGTGSSFNLTLSPDQSCFIVATDSRLPAKNLKPYGGPAIDLSHDWKVTFNPKMGGSGKPLEFKTLKDWTHSNDKSVEYYSGTAVYHKDFYLDSAPAKNALALLRFEKLNWMAKVIINGHDAGIVWCSPWSVNVAPYLRKGKNTITLEVTNSLYNRMIGDLDKKEDERCTHSSYPLVDSSTPLVPSGISGKLEIR